LLGGEIEFPADEQQRTRDAGKVVSVDDADAGRGEPDQQSPRRRTLQLTRDFSSSMKLSGFSGTASVWQRGSNTGGS
jgi:hypothetical protein